MLVKDAPQITVNGRLGFFAINGLLPPTGSKLLILSLFAFVCITPIGNAENGHPGTKPGTVTASGNQRPKRILQAASLAARVSQGLDLNIVGAVIRGPLNLRFMVITQQVSLVDCEFEETLDFSYSTFKRHLVFDRSRFKNGLKLESATVDLNATMNGTNFPAGKAIFRDLQVHGRLLMQNAHFGEGVSARFEGAHFDKGADFSRDIFGADANFEEIQVGSDLMFRAAHFEKVFVLTTAKIAGSLFLTEGEFNGSAQLPGIQVAYNFKAERARFKDRANFSESQTGSFIDLTGTRFEFTQRPANFERATVIGGGFFDRVHFAGGAKFESAHFVTDATFEGAVFDGAVSFDRAHFDQSGHFERSVFKRDVSFHEAAFGVFDLSPDGRAVGQDQFQGRVNLEGCTYHGIQVHWQSLFRTPDGNSRLTAIDKQPYSTLSKFYQAGGNGDLADEVDLEWHRVKRQQMFQRSKASWLLDCVSWLTTNYGVAVDRLVGISVFIVLLGMLIFSRPDAVRGEGSDGSPGPQPALKASRLSHWDALAVSLHQFLPLDVPLGSQWTPASSPIGVNFRYRKREVILFAIRPSTFATVLKISGYILVPLEILVLNGLLRSGDAGFPWQ
jgi:hypothetical protein